MHILHPFLYFFTLTRDFVNHIFKNPCMHTPRFEAHKSIWCLCGMEGLMHAWLFIFAKKTLQLCYICRVLVFPMWWHCILHYVNCSLSRGTLFHHVVTSVFNFVFNILDKNESLYVSLSKPWLAKSQCNWVV